MPSKKNKVVSFLTDEELKEFNALKKEMDTTNSDLVIGLVRLWGKPEETKGSQSKTHLYDEKIERLEKQLDAWATTQFKVSDGLDSLKERFDEREERLRKLEHWSTVETKQRIVLVDKQEKLEEEACDLQYEVDTLREGLKNISQEQITDDVIAAVTGQREQTVKEWRHGLRTPRGSRILKKLEPYDIKDGRWIKRR